MGTGISSRRLRYRLTLAAMALAGLTATWLLGQTAFFQLLHLKARDLHFLLRGARPTADVALIVVDQQTLDTYKEPLLFWHGYYAEAIRAAAAGGAKALGLDVTFAIPVDQWAPELDQKLVEAVLEVAPTMPVICAYIPSTLNLQAERPVPLNMVAASFGRGAFANIRVDSDDFVREVELMEQPQPGSTALPVRGLALRTAEAFLDVETKLNGGEVWLGNHHIPTRRPRTMIINFAGPPGTIPRVPMADVIAAHRAGRIDKLRQWFGGKAVLLGMDSIDDRHATPYYRFAPGKRANTAGVEIQASALDTLIHGAFLLDVPVWIRFGILLIAAVATAAAAGIFVGKRLTLVLAGGAAAIIGITHLLFRAGWLLSDSEVMLTAALSAGPVLAYRSLSAERRGSLFQRAVAVFVGGQVADALDRTETIARSGKRQNVTILFSDIRGFTAFCEEKDPSVVVDLLNRYMETMVGVIVKYRGHVDKFIGDGIMAVFSDDDGTSSGDHAERAVRCALEMVRQPGQFKTGTGIHSGLVVVGVVGSSQKMEFTALGNTVNLASRLESLNKEHKTQLLMSDETRLLLPPDMETFCLGEVAVRGKMVPMKIHTLMEIRPVAAAAAG